MNNKLKATVMKFGGTSVGDVQGFRRVANIIGEHIAARPVVVVSAMSGITDQLLECADVCAKSGDAREAAPLLADCITRHKRVAKELLSATRAAAVEQSFEESHGEIESFLMQVADFDELHKSAAQESVLSVLPALQDTVVAYGEQLSARLLAALLDERSLAAHYVDARRLIITDANHGCAEPIEVETEQATRYTLEPLIAANTIPVFGGFIASTFNGSTTTLGRNGSDFTAALVGKALSSCEVQIWTDTSGVLTADPEIVPEAETVLHLSYAEAADLALFGAEVLHPKTIAPLVAASIPLRVRNSRLPNEAGTLITLEPKRTARVVKSIAYRAGRPTATHSTTNTVSLETEVESRPVVCIVGTDLFDAKQITKRIRHCLDKHEIAFILLDTTSTRLLLELDQADVVAAVRFLHKEFFADQLTTQEGTHAFLGRPLDLGSPSEVNLDCLQEC